MEVLAHIPPVFRGIRREFDRLAIGAVGRIARRSEGVRGKWIGLEAQSLDPSIGSMEEAENRSFVVAVTEPWDI